MKRCSAPCVKKINKIDYFEDISSAKSYLSSTDSQTVDRLTNDIDKAVDQLDFEKAADIRDRLKRLNILREEQSVVTRAKDVDIFSVHNQDTYLGICIIVVGCYICFCHFTMVSFSFFSSSFSSFLILFLID